MKPFSFKNKLNIKRIEKKSKLLSTSKLFLNTFKLSFHTHFKQVFKKWKNLLVRKTHKKASSSKGRCKKPTFSEHVSNGGGGGPPVRKGRRKNRCFYQHRSNPKIG